MEVLINAVIFLGILVIALLIIVFKLKKRLDQVINSLFEVNNVLKNTISSSNRNWYNIELSINSIIHSLAEHGLFGNDEPIEELDEDNFEFPDDQKDFQVDILLDKIKNYGIDSLTYEEKEYLDNFSGNS